jgi:hypothetical protein
MAHGVNANRHGLRRLDLQPLWRMAAVVAHGGWWSNLINFQMVVQFCNMIKKL